MNSTTSSRIEIRVTGFGGQGVVMAAYIIGRACAINAGKHATMIQSFGPEARGSSCSATLVVDDQEVLYPYIDRPGISVVMSTDGYEKYRDELCDSGILIYESDLVKIERALPSRAFGIPSTRIAEALGRPLVQNIVMVGFVAAATSLVPREAMRQAALASVPAGTEEINLKAFDAGVDYFDTVIAPKAAEVMA